MVQYEENPFVIVIIPITGCELSMTKNLVEKRGEQF